MVKKADPDDGFLSRWSRRKLEVAAEARAAETKAAEVETGAGADLNADIVPQATEAEPVAAHPEAEPEPEFIEPPSLEIIDKDFDLAHWLKQNVPESWKLAALRRTWETDPFIHGYLNPAREYALDWNTPGGAPGYGPLTESDDVKAMIARIFGDLPEAKPEAAAAGDDQLLRDDPEGLRLSDKTALSEADIAAMRHDGPGLADSDDQAGSAPAPLPLNPLRLSENGPVPVDAANAALQHKPAPEPVEPAPVLRSRRRSGGAIPV